MEKPINSISLVIDGKQISVPSGTTILDAAKQVGITIPALCYHPKVSRSGACRVCMRRDLIDLILSDHPYDCMVCQKTGECELQELAYKYSIRNPVFRGERRQYAQKDGNPFIDRDMEKCILCGRCVKICDEVQGVGAIDFAYKGFWAKVCPPFEQDLNCEFCGQCVMVCPTGALIGKNWVARGRYWNMREVESTCPYCGVGCTLSLHVKENEIVRVTAKEGRGVNDGLLCVKGRFGYQFVSSPDRLKTPLIRRRKGGDLEPATWDEALGVVASRLKRVKEQYGPDAIAGLSSARCTTEDNYLFQKFMRAAVGTNNVDHCARL
jgi:predicted molibdopterin-dependent oxidoreductase YjgC